MTTNPLHLGVNIDHVATLRQVRGTSYPRPVEAAVMAELAGADSITVLPFTAALGLPDSFARRVARNSQIILQDESGMALVNDPAAGSGAVEALTGEIAARAWAVLFR